MKKTTTLWHSLIFFIAMLGIVGSVYSQNTVGTPISNTPVGLDHEPSIHVFNGTTNDKGQVTTTLEKGKYKLILSKVKAKEIGVTLKITPQGGDSYSLPFETTPLAAKKGIAFEMKSKGTVLVTIYDRGQEITEKPSGTKPVINPTNPNPEPETQKTTPDTIGAGPQKAPINTILGATPIITLGGGTNIPLGTSKTEALLPTSTGGTANVYFPILGKGFDSKVKKYLTFGVNVGGSFSTNVQKQPTGDYKAINITGQSSPPTLLVNSGSGKSQNYIIDAGSQLNFSTGGFMISPILNMGYMNISRNDVSVKQTTMFGILQPSLSTDLYSQKITKGSGLAVIPKLRLAYFFGKSGIGMWAESAYTHGPSINVETTKFIPNENPENPGVYDIGLIQEGTYKTTVSNFHYSGFSVNAGISFAIKTFKKQRHLTAKLQEPSNLIFDTLGLSNGESPEIPKHTEAVSCVPTYETIIDKTTCDGDRILVKGHINIPLTNTVAVNTIFITSIKQNSGNSIITSLGQLPKLITGAGNGQANAFEFYIDRTSCGQDLVIEYDMNCNCSRYKSEGKSLEKSQVKKGRIVIPGRDIICCGDNHEVACLNDPVINGNFMLGSVPGPMPVGQVANWSMAYSITASGKPIVNSTVGQGCLDTGYVVLSGNNNSGNAISQSLANGNKIVSGKKYTFYVSVRFIQGQPLDYGKIRLIAYNGVLPTTGGHPGPQTDIAIIGRSGKIHDCGDWSIVEFPVWKANKNFDNIAINAFTNDNTFSKVYIDNISACETTQSNCGELQLDAQGQPIAPTGYSGPMPTGPCQPEAEEESSFNGSLVDLYGYDGTPAMYSDANGDECANIGGTLPDEFKTYDCNASLSPSEGLTCNDIDRILNTDLSKIKEPKIVYDPIAPLSTNQPTCPKLSVGDHYSMAFSGRDIIFVHGLMNEHITNRLTDTHPGAQADWPDKAEFYGNGYYKRVAIENWKHHIQHFLQGKGRKNRYLIVTYNCSQRAEFAIQSVMNQIRDAMENGTDVVTSDGDPRGKSCFGKDYVMISHSTGGLIGDLVLAKANKSKTDPTEQAKYGNVGFISDRCKTHISMAGAMGGSNLATMAVAIAGGSVVTTPVRTLITEALGLHTLSPIILTSVLVDLCPAVTYYKWHWDLDDVPVPVLTIAGGHPASFTGALVNILPGIDDGVVSMESASGRNKPFISPISQFATTWPPRVYDMGIAVDRAKGFFRDSRRGIDRFGIASSPYLSQTGMVEPKYSIYYINPQHKNHYNFIQSSKEHLQPASNIYFGLNNYMRTLLLSANPEEELVTDMDSPVLYGSGLINPAIQRRMGESIAGLPMLYPNLRYKKGRFYIFWKKFWIWKRTYHKLDGDEYDMDFAYKYILTP